MASSATPLHDSLIELAIPDAHAHAIKWYLNKDDSSVFISVRDLSPIPIPDSPYCDWSVHHITQNYATGDNEIQPLEETGVPWRSRDDGRWSQNYNTGNNIINYVKAEKNNFHTRTLWNLHPALCWPMHDLPR